jgi:hypothetical protein
MAGRAGLLPTMGEGGEVVAMSPSAGGETTVEDSVSNGSASKFSRPKCNNNKESMDPFARLCHWCRHRRHRASKREKSR